MGSMLLVLYIAYMDPMGIYIYIYYTWDILGPCIKWFIWGWDLLWPVWWSLWAHWVISRVYGYIELVWTSTIWYPIGSMVLLYMVCHGSHQYTPVMLALIYQHHGSYLILGWGFIKQLAHLGPRGPGAWLHLEGLATYHFFCTEKPNKSDH